MSWPYPPLPPDTRAVGTGNPPQDMDQVVDYLTALTGRVKAGVFDPRDYGAVGDGVHDDTTAINACITATPVNGGIVDLGKSPVTYAISAPISCKAGCTFIGSFANAQAATAKLDIATLGTFSGIAAMADAGALATGTSPSSTYPLSIIGVSIDLTACPGSTTDGFRFMTYGCWAYYCMTKNAPANGFHYTDQNAGGHNIVNTAVENRICNSGFVRSGNCGILVDNNVQALTDGYCCDNIIQHRSINIQGFTSNATGPGIDIEYCADWQVRGNHVYACPLDAIVLRNLYGSFIDGNDVDTFGLAGTASTTYHGIYAPNCLAGAGSTITDNMIRSVENFGAASTAYQYFYLGASTSATANVVLSGNTAYQGASGSGSSTALTMAGGTGVLNVIQSGDFVVGTTISATTVTGGTVNLLRPGGTTLNSGAVSVPLGVSSSYGTLTTITTPLIPGSAIAFAGVSIVWGGTFAGDTVNVQLTVTFDDGTTQTQATSTATSVSTQNFTAPALLNLFKQGRQVIKLAAQARTTAASTSVTCTVTIIGVAV